MTSPAVRVPVRRRSWLEPALWLGVPALVAIGPWAMREWTAARSIRHPGPTLSVHLTGDTARDRLALVERAWAEVRPRRRTQTAPPLLPERYALRDALWLADIAEQLLPLDRTQAEQAAMEAIQRAGDLPERMGPEDLMTPAATPTGRLLRLAHSFRPLPAIARRARRAALARARAAEGTSARIYALCLIARESASADPSLARASLREARALIARLSGSERLGALAALAGSSVGVERPAAVRMATANALRELGESSPSPVTLSVAASLIAPAAPAASGRLASQAVERAAVASAPPDDDWAFRGDSDPGQFAESGGWRAVGFRSPRARPRVVFDRSRGGAADPQLRRVAAALAPAHPAAAESAALRIRRAEDRSGALTEVAALLEETDPARAAVLYRLSLQAADQMKRPVAARRAARLRAACGLAAYDAPVALAVVAPLPPRLMALQLAEFTARLARREPEEALRLIERGEQSVETAENAGNGLFAPARGAVAARLVRRDPARAAAVIAPLRGRRAVAAWLALARCLTADGASR